MSCGIPCRFQARNLANDMPYYHNPHVLLVRLYIMPLLGSAWYSSDEFIQVYVITLEDVWMLRASAAISVNDAAVLTRALRHAQSFL